MTILSPGTEFDANSALDWSKYREKNFPIVKKWSYFDHAAVSPLPQPTREAIQQWLNQATCEGDTVWPQWAQRLEEIRKTAAALVQAESSEMALIPSTSFGISLVAEGLEWKPGDNVVIPAGEFPSNLYPWMNLKSRGVELRIVPTGPLGEVTAEQIDKYCDRNTQLVSASWVGYATGYRVHPGEIAEVAHRHQAFFFLDAIQGLGVFPLDVRKTGVDFFAADGHKWMMGPEGAGLFYCRRELLENIHPRVVGWNSVESSYDFSSVEFKLKNTAARFEAGTQNMAGLLGLGASLDLISSVGVTPEYSPMAGRILEIADLLISRLGELGWSCESPIDDQHRSGIISFSKTGVEPVAIRKILLEHNVVSSVRKGNLRFSPHAYINHDDVDRIVEVLSEC